MNVKIYSRYILNQDDIELLMLLYLPILNKNTVIFFIFLFSLVNKSTLESSIYTYDDIKNLLNLTDNELDECLLKLESLNLINRYQKKDLELILLKNVPTAKNFLEESKLGVFLKNKVSDELYFKLTNNFILNDINLDEYKNITRCDFSFFNNLDIDGIIDKRNIKGKRPNVIKMKDEFSFSEFIKLIDIELVNQEDIVEFEKACKKYYKLYDFNYNILKNLFVDAIDKNGFFNLVIFNDKALKTHTYIITQQVNENESDEMLIALETSDYMDILESLFKDKIDKKVMLHKITCNLKDYYDEIGLNKGLANALLIYVYKQKQDIPDIKYFKKVKESWMDLGISKTIDAIKYIEGNYTSDSKRKYTKKRVINNNISDELSKRVNNVLDRWDESEEN